MADMMDGGKGMSPRKARWPAVRTAATSASARS